MIKKKDWHKSYYYKVITDMKFTLRVRQGVKSTVSYAQPTKIEPCHTKGGALSIFVQSLFKSGIWAFAPCQLIPLGIILFPTTSQESGETVKMCRLA